MRLPRLPYARTRAVNHKVEEMVAIELHLKSNELLLKAKELALLQPSLEPVRSGAIRYKKIKYMEDRAAAYSKASEFLLMVSQGGEEE